MKSHRAISRRAAKVAPFLAMDVMREARQRLAAGDDVVRMEVGQPFGQAPRKVLEAARAAMREEPLGYTDAAGLLPLRERIARHYRETHGIDVDPARVFITTGSSGAFLLAFLAAFDAGDAVGLPNPGYPAYRNIFHALGITPRLLPAGAAQGWAPRVEEVAAKLKEGMKGLLVASPANPTGAIIDDARLRALIETVEAAGGWFISDEIYHGLTYERPATTALAFSERAIVINSFSKYYAMTGWRIGWMVLPDELRRVAEVLGQNLFISAPTISQHAAIAAFDATEELQERRAGYAANRDLLLNELPRIGLGALAPADGAFYLYADVSHLTNDSITLSRRLLREARVAVTSGLDFDPLDGGRFLRLSYAGSHDDMARAVERLAAWMKENA
ncbi:MAG TPA: aminotransferase class I/II-fold pyridoxal phosphate-dependent enzyme [Thermopetrobacter sp.]|nr:aminotransferase class I/II-fold pyridoxal phosphate-dependent enzyme [Thermopetrobacter sp.]